MSLFDEMLKNKDYAVLFENLSDDERKAIEQALRNFVEDFENRIIKPLQILKEK